MTFKMVPEDVKFALFSSSALPKVQITAYFMPKGTIFIKECKKVLFNSFVMMQFS